ncbi:MAG TPA: potassium transporter TrkG [Pirellulaceae bacterium]|nr:potassium transporter TrkG [Pirellulaceae bacterium]HMO93084.1 potassium transporter TrkG [Pirellulaceae bacterium]HMP69965.1 potassium transporter TrkG [Pirellulaceae bacterium]
MARSIKQKSTRRISLFQHPGVRNSRFPLFKRGLTPSELFALSFLAMIFAGTMALKFIPGLYTGDELSWTDAVFTSTSAVCVTGLIVVDTATFFTPLGQLVILVLIQMGGLGMLLLTSFIITALGGRPSLRAESAALGGRHVNLQVSSRKLIYEIVRFVLFVETLGAIALYAIWAPRLGWVEAIWPSIFHSVSAFCNAGFSTYSNSLVDFHDSWITIVVVSALVICGGLGFITLEEVQHRYFRRNGSLRRLSTHSRLVFLMCLVLTLGVWPLFAFFEWNGVLQDMTLTDKVSNAFFMSVTPRTAGFNTISYVDASDSTNFLTMILMMIGGAPGSTAGGMKTTTFALLGLLAWSRLRSQPTVTFARRSIPNETIQRATGLFVIATGIVVIAVFALAYLGDAYDSDQEFLARLFEAVSAFNTVGLSLDASPQLATASRWVVIVLMFIGRTGPLSIAAALAGRLSSRSHFRFAYEDVVVG